MICVYMYTWSCVQQDIYVCIYVYIYIYKYIYIWQNKGVCNSYLWYVYICIHDLVYSKIYIYIYIYITNFFSLAFYSWNFRASFVYITPFALSHIYIYVYVYKYNYKYINESTELWEIIWILVQCSSEFFVTLLIVVDEDCLVQSKRTATK